MNSVNIWKIINQYMLWNPTFTREMLYEWLAQNEWHEPNNGATRSKTMDCTARKPRYSHQGDTCPKQFIVCPLKLSSEVINSAVFSVDGIRGSRIAKNFYPSSMALGSKSSTIKRGPLLPLLLPAFRTILFPVSIHKRGSRILQLPALW